MDPDKFIGCRFSLSTHTGVVFKNVLSGAVGVGEGWQRRSPGECVTVGLTLLFHPSPFFPGELGALCVLCCGAVSLGF